MSSNVLKTKDKKNESYSGSKADIFSLGVILFFLLAGFEGFNLANSKDKLYHYIIYDKSKYFEQITRPINISPEFQKLYLDMISFEEGDRPSSIQHILENNLFNEINNLNDEKQKELIKEEIEPLENIFNKKKTVNYNPNKSGKNESFVENQIFNDKTKIRCIRNENIFENYIKINGYLNPVNFMNEYANEMEDLYDIEYKKKYFKFNIIIKKKEKEFGENSKDLDNNISFNSENISGIEKDIIIKVELVKNRKNELLLNFIKGNGSLKDYYKYLKEVMEYAEVLIKI